jgi:hypothetical protein
MKNITSIMSRSVRRSRGAAVLGIAFVLIAGALQGQQKPTYQIVAPDLVPPGDEFTTRVIQAKVTDRQGVPATGQSVLFVAPDRGPGGTFSTGDTFVRVATDGNGIASTSFTTNGTPGVFLIEAFLEGTIASVTIPFTIAPGAPTPALPGGAVRDAVAQALHVSQFDETLALHGPVLVPQGTTIDAALPRSVVFPGQPYTTGRLSYVLWIDDQPKFRFTHLTRFIVVDANDTSADLSKAHISREESWPVLTLPNSSMINSLLPPAGVNTAWAATSPLGLASRNKLVPMGVNKYPAGDTCAVLVHGVVEGGPQDVQNMRGALVNSGKVAAGNVFMQGDVQDNPKPGGNAPVTRAELDRLIKMVAAKPCKKVYMLISSHGYSDGKGGGALDLFNDDPNATSQDDFVSFQDLANMLSQLKGIELCLIVDACHVGDVGNWLQGIGLTGTFAGATNAAGTATGINGVGGSFTSGLITGLGGDALLPDAFNGLVTNGGTYANAGHPVLTPLQSGGPTWLKLKDITITPGSPSQPIEALLVPSAPGLFSTTLTLVGQSDVHFDDGSKQIKYLDGQFPLGTLTHGVSGTAWGETRLQVSATDPVSGLSYFGSANIYSTTGPYFVLPPLPGSYTLPNAYFNIIGDPRVDEIPHDVQFDIVTLPPLVIPVPEMHSFSNSLHVDFSLPDATLAPIDAPLHLGIPGFALDPWGSDTTLHIGPLPPVISLDDPAQQNIIAGTTPLTIVLRLNDHEPGDTVVLVHPDGTQEQPPYQPVTTSARFYEFSITHIYDKPGLFFAKLFRHDGTASNSVSINVALPPPVLIRLDQSTFVAGPDPQRILIFGGGLDPTIQIYLDPPNGAPSVQSTPVSVTPEVATILARLQSTGAWKLHAQYGDGPPSNSLSFNVTGALPVIDQIVTKGIVAQSAPQTITLQAHNVQAGALAEVTRPDNGSILTPLRIAGPTTDTYSTYAFDTVLAELGNYEIDLRNPDLGMSLSVSINVMGPLPVIDQVVTPGLTTQSGTQTVKLQCHNIQLGAVVVVTRPDGTSGETPLGANVQNLTYTVNFVFDQPGAYKMQVRNPDGGLSSSVSISAISLGLTLTGVTVDDPNANGFLKTLTVTGTSLVAGGTFALKQPDQSVLTFNALQLQNFSSTGFQVATVLPQPGGYSAQYINPDQKFTNVIALNLLGVNTTPAIITSVNPSTTPAGPNTVIVTVMGSGFNGMAGVKVGAATIPVAQFLSLSSNSFSFAFTFQSAGSVPVQVVGSGNVLSNIVAITVTGGGTSAPAITGFSPTSLVAGTGQQTLVINGQNFSAGANVTVTPPGGAPTQAQVLNVTPTSITIGFTFASAGQYSITVTSGGQSSNTSTFIVTAPAQPPMINGFSPNTLVAAAGTQTLVINGQNFSANANVTVGPPGGVPSQAQVLNVTPTSITFGFTFANAGQYSITVTYGGQSSNTATFFVTAPAQVPTINAVAPANLHPGGPQPVGVMGANFANGLSVVLTLPNSTQQTFSGAQIQNMTPNGFVLLLTLQPGTYTIRVVNPGGVSSAPFTFAVN